MEELRFVRRDDQALVVVGETGEEYRLVVDDAVLSELRHLSRREREAPKLKPREIQSMIRSGKSTAEVARLIGVEEIDIERYADPVLAERQYILERAQAVPVRASAGRGADTPDEDQKFGEVIAERLVGLTVEVSEWSSWRDDEAGWMVALEFISHDVDHRAVWSFDHRKSVLAPINTDAVNLSKQGDVGDRLIPKLRAVDSEQGAGRFDSAAFSVDDLPAAEAGSDEGQADPEPSRTQGEAASTDAQTERVDTDAEYERRREIDHRAVKTVDGEPVDLSQTADLLDALRRRRGERERLAQEQREAPAAAEPPTVVTEATETAEPVEAATSAAPIERAEPRGERKPSAPRSIWSGAGVSSDAPAARSTRGDGAGRAFGLGAAASEQHPASTDDGTASSAAKRDSERGPRKGRASLPSWDDILFGTRSDDDPA